MARDADRLERTLYLTRPPASSRMATLASAAMQPETLTAEQMLSILREFEELKACVH